MLDSCEVHRLSQPARMLRHLVPGSNASMTNWLGAVHVVHLQAGSAAALCPVVLPSPPLLSEHAPAIPGPS
jgi:hypothetical protein